MNNENDISALSSTLDDQTESPLQLLLQIQQGIDSPSIPADEAADRLRQFAQLLVQNKY